MLYNYNDQHDHGGEIYNDRLGSLLISSINLKRNKFDWEGFVTPIFYFFKLANFLRSYKPFFLNLVRNKYFGVGHSLFATEYL